MRASRPGRRIILAAAALCATAAPTCPRAADDDAFGLEQSLARGRFTFELRPRYPWLTITITY